MDNRELSFREFYNLLVEETPNHETYPLVLRDPDYIKIKFKNEPEWPLLENEQYRQNLSYASVRPPLYKINIEEKSDDPEEFYLAGKFSDFLAEYPAVNVSLDCPAAVSDIIYLGALRHVSQFILEELKIGLVLSVGAKPNSATLEFMKSKGVENIFIDAYDEKTEKLSRFFPQFCEILQNCETKKIRCLVHCRMGMSRSVSAVTAFYIKSGKTFAEAGQLIKNARQKVRPNNGFINQLMDWEEKCHGCRKTSESEIPY